MSAQIKHRRGKEMKLAEARALAREIQTTGPACTVPYGYGPDGYFARIVSSWRSDDTDLFASQGRAAAPVDFHDREEWEAWRAKRVERDTQRDAIIAAHSQPRSSLDILIDRACGIEPKP